MTHHRNSLRSWLVRCLCVCALGTPGLLIAQTPGTRLQATPASEARAGAKPVALPAGPIVRQVEFRDVPLSDALRLVTRQTGLNLIASQEAGKAKVSLFLQDVPARSVVEELCRANNLWYRQDEATGVIRIMTVAEFQRDLTAFREEQTEVFSVLYPNAAAIATAISDLYGDRVQLSLGADDVSDESRDINERFSRFDMVDQRSQGIGLFGAGGTTIVGGSRSGVGNQTYGSSYTSSTGVRQSQGRQASPDQPTDGSEGFRQLTPGQAEAVSRAVQEPQASAQQQALLAALQRKQANIFVRVMRRNNLIVVRTGDQAALQEIAKLVRRLDVPTPMVLLEVKVLSIALGDGFSSVFDYQFSDGSRVAGGFTSGNILPPASDALSGTAQKFASLMPGGTAVQQTDLLFQFVSESFRLRMQLLEDKNRVTELATPLLLTANSEVSRLFVGEERPIVRNISSQVVVNTNNTTVAPSTTIEFRPVGTTLLLTPTINADRTVTLRLLQENSRIVANGANIPVVTSDGNIVSQPVDVVATRTLSGTIVAKDGLMLAVGGLIEEQVTDIRSEVPILGKMPGLGFFFRRQETGRSRNELIIMIRPHVLNTPAESEAMSKDLVQSLSIHPNANDPGGTLKNYDAGEVLRPSLPTSKQDAMFRFHSVAPADY